MTLSDANHSLLMVIDAQERLGAVMPAKVINRVLNNTVLLLQAAALFEVPVIVTEQYPKGLGPTIAAIGANLPATAVRFEKTAFAATAAPGVLDRIAASGRGQIIVSGMEAHVCVLQTAVRLMQAGREVMVVEDAVCSRKLENYQNALDRMRRCGITVVSTESILFEWLADKNHPRFKTLATLIR
jgi:nicotinamidase-related amidase